jgi:WD40 repeat protein/serine/threonine protein kinase
MSSGTPATFVEQLAQDQLLGDIALVEWEALARRCSSVGDLIEEAIRRGWLTGYQSELLREGRGSELRVGPFAVLALLGLGAMGRVFEARNVSTGQVVALKVMRPEMADNPKAFQRFLRECRVGFELEHPNIARPIETGMAGDSPYLAMEFVPGTDLAELVNEQGPLSPGQACECARQAALALQHAHERGLVHRDIKPSNLRVTSGGTGPALVKVLDFGLARLHSEADHDGRLTQMGTLVGTVDYVAPEQAMDPRVADTRADIYSLGCTLFYLLTGKPPFPGVDKVARLSARVLGPPPSVRDMRPDIPADLAAILLRMMAREPEKRYQEPAEVAALLAPFAAPMLPSAPAPKKAARTPTVVEPSSAPTASSMPESSMPGSSMPGSSVLEPEPRPRRGRGRAAPAFWRSPVTLGITIVGSSTFLLAILLVVLLRNAPAGTPNPAPGPIANSGKDNRRKHPAEKLPAPTPAPAPAQGPLPAPLPAPTPAAGPLGLPKNALTGHKDRIASVAFSPDGKRIVSGSDDKTLKVWDAQTGKELHTLTGHTRSVGRVAYSPDGARIVSGGQESNLRIWDANRGQEVLSLKDQTGPTVADVFSPDGKRAVGCLDRTLKVWDTQTGQEVLALRGQKGLVRKAIFTPDGSRLLLAYLDAKLAIWDAQAGHELLTLKGEAHCLDLSRDGKRVVGGSMDKTVKVWDTQTGQELHSLPYNVNEGAISIVAISPDGKRVAARGILDHSVKAWDAQSGKETLSVEGTSFVVFSPDLKYVVSDSGGGLLKVWDAQTGQERFSFPARTDRGATVVFSPDGTRLVGMYPDNTLKLWDLATGKEVRTFAGHTNLVTSVAFSPDGKRIVSGSEDRTLKVWDATPSPAAWLPLIDLDRLATRRLD